MNQDSLILVCPACNTRNRVPVSRMDESPKCGKCKSLLPVESLSMPVTVTDADFAQQVFGSSLPVVVDCWAPWCGPCRAFGPVIDQLAQQYRGKIKFAKLNLDDNPVTGSQYGISSVPTILLVKNGRLVDKLVGALPKEQLEAQIARIF